MTNLCETCDHVDRDRHAIREGEPFWFCTREGFFMVGRTGCGFYRRGAE